MAAGGAYDQTANLQQAKPRGPFGGPRLRRVVLEALRAPLAAKTWQANAFLLIGSVLALPGLVFVIASLGLGAALTLTLLGLPILAVAGSISLWLGGVHRSLAEGTLGEKVSAARRKPSGRGMLGWLQSRLTDTAAWKAHLYLVLKAPVVLGGALIMFVGYFQGSYLLLYPAFWATSSAVGAGHTGPVINLVGLSIGVSHHALSHALTLRMAGLYFNNWPLAIVVSIGGLVWMLILPWVLRGVVALDVTLMRLLLGPGSGVRRVEQLETARSLVAQDAAATLRRIERDLHDGTQAQLVALAMNLGAIRERLEDRKGSADPDTLERITAAHERAKEAVADLRNIARGIHPPALDLGLGEALATLAARSAVPVRLEDSLRAEPSEVVATIAYFSVAELLTNVARHARASTAAVTVTQRRGRLLIAVSDDGQGGASVRPGSALPGQGSGLRGLAARASAVDGSLEIDSPRGGPTTMVVELPMEV